MWILERQGSTARNRSEKGVGARDVTRWFAVFNHVGGSQPLSMRRSLLPTST
jgi:hypothetical protein